MPWQDSLAVQKAHQAAFTDSGNYWSDALAKSLMAPLEVSLSDSGPSMADALQASLGLKAVLSDSASANWTDAFAGFLAYRAALADDLSYWSDLLEKYLSTLTTPIEVSLTDSMPSPADALQAVCGLKAILSDSAAGNWTDSLTGSLAYKANLNDNVDYWSDFLEKYLTGLAAIEVSLTDSLPGWSDAMSAALGLRAALTDSFSQQDALAARLNLLAAFTDNAGQLSDALAVIKGHLAALSDSSASWSDVLAIREGLLADLTEVSPGLADALAGFLTHEAGFSDNMANWIDQLAASYGAEETYDGPIRPVGKVRPVGRPHQHGMVSGYDN